MSFLEVPGIKPGQLDALTTAKINDPASATHGALNTTYGRGLSVKQFGAKGDGTTDDTAAIQAAHDALPVNGGGLFFPAGKYVVSATINITKPTTLRGVGMGDHMAGTTGRVMSTYDTSKGQSIIATSSLTLFVLDVNAPGFGACDIAIANTATGAAPPTAGAGIKIRNGDSARLTRVRVAGFYDNITFEQSEYASITDCLIVDPVRYGLYARNLFNSDQGDMTVVGTAFTMSGGFTRNASAALRMESGGGLKFTSNKVNMGWASTSRFDIGIDARMADGTSTADILVTGNSFENCLTALIRLGRTGTTGVLKYVTITGNEFAANAAANGIDIDAGVHTGVIAGNVFATLTKGINVKNTGGWRIGANTYAGDVGTAVAIVNPSGYVEVDRQTVTAIPCTIITDASIAPAIANITYDYGVTVPVTTGATVTTLFRLGVLAYTSVTVDFHVGGSVTGVGQYGIRARRTFSRGASGAITVTTPTGWTDDIIGTTPPAIAFDSATIAGEGRITIALNGGGTGISGFAQVRAMGQLALFRIGA